MAFPTTGILDDFNRADEAPLSGGGNWLGRGIGFQLDLTSNQVLGANQTSLSSRYWTPATYGPDCEAYISVPVLSATAVDYVRLWLRVTNPGVGAETGYVMQWSNDANGCRIFKETSRETFTTISTNAAARFVAGDQLGLEAIGTQITVYQDGVAVTTVSDGTFTDAGNLALGVRDNQHRLDDFGGGTVVVAATDVLAMQTHVMGHNFW